MAVTRGPRGQGTGPARIAKERIYIDERLVAAPGQPVPDGVDVDEKLVESPARTTAKQAPDADHRKRAEDTETTSSRRKRRDS